MHYDYLCAGVYDDGGGGNVAKNGLSGVSQCLELLAHLPPTLLTGGVTIKDSS